MLPLRDWVSRLSPKNRLLIATVFILVVLVLPQIIKIHKKQTITLPQPTTLPQKPTEKTTAQTTFPQAALTIRPTTQIVKPQQPFQLDIVVDNNRNPISAVSLKLLYDKDMITLDSPTLGSFFDSPMVFENTVDNKRGLVSLSLGSTTPATESGILVHVNGVVNPNVTGETDLIILPESKITQYGSTNSILSRTGQTTLNVILY